MEYNSADQDQRFTTKRNCHHDCVTRLMSPVWSDHSPDNVKFPDGSRHSSVALGMLSVTHIMPVLVLNTCMDANMQLTINSFRQLFPDTSLTFSKVPDISLTVVKIPDISRFSIQLVTL